jgi:hypothetical protein
VNLVAAASAAAVMGAVSAVGIRYVARGLASGERVAPPVPQGRDTATRVPVG